jgi:hypothetical protein
MLSLHHFVRVWAGPGRPSGERCPLMLPHKPLQSVVGLRQAGMARRTTETVPMSSGIGGRHVDSAPQLVRPGGDVLPTANDRTIPSVPSHVQVLAVSNECVAACHSVFSTARRIVDACPPAKGGEKDGIGGMHREDWGWPTGADHRLGAGEPNGHTTMHLWGVAMGTTATRALDPHLVDASRASGEPGIFIGSAIHDDRETCDMADLADRRRNRSCA